jgi:hypothetical protein
VREPDPDVYYEVHHIIPKCMGGGNEKENLTTLTAREHFIAHWLLARIYPEHQGIGFSFWMMCNVKYIGKRDYIISSRAYEEARSIFRENLNKIWETPEIWNKQSERQKKIWQNPEYRENQRALWEDTEYRERMSKINSEAAKKKWEDPGYREKQEKLWGSEDFKVKASEAAKKIWERPEHMEKMTAISNLVWEDEERREKQREITKNTWRNPEFRQKMDKIYQGLRKFTQEQVQEIRNEYAAGGCTQIDLSKKYGVGVKTICDLINKKGTYK